MYGDTVGVKKYLASVGFKKMRSVIFITGTFQM